jgi:ethanolamine ammonia-lyase small subunit
MKFDQVEQNSWQYLRKFTQARIALGRAGNSLPTDAVLNFGLAHAQARDAVHEPLDTELLETELMSAGFSALHVESQAKDRREYLIRPDRGRNLDPTSRDRLVEASRVSSYDAAFVIADGLSAFAPMRHAVQFLQLIRMRLEGWTLAPITLARQARVALGDEIGELLKAEMVVMLIGERPGLSSPDSLGVYLTYQPRVGRSDADRNCISNLRPEGMDLGLAAFKLHHLMENARHLKLSGVGLKDNSDSLLGESRPESLKASNVPSP